MPKTSERQTLLRAAIAAVRDCADSIDQGAVSLGQSLQDVSMEDSLRTTVDDLCAKLRDASSRVTFELALLQTELGEEKADIESAVQRLSRMDATMMSALESVPDVVDKLEKSAERDEQYEPAFVLVIEAAGVMLQSLDRAKAATLRMVGH
jgi:chromosome segregation ATPase